MEINELVVSVNNALNSCAGSPTPTVPPGGQCPIDLSDDNTQPGTQDCYYIGRWNQSCGAADQEADGTRRVQQRDEDRGAEVMAEAAGERRDDQTDARRDGCADRVRDRDLRLADHPDPDRLFPVAHRPL